MNYFIVIIVIGVIILAGMAGYFVLNQEAPIPIRSPLPIVSPTPTPTPKSAPTPNPTPSISPTPNPTKHPSPTATATPVPTITPAPISLQPKGVYALIDWGEIPRQTVLQNPSVDGVIARVYWKDLNPRKGDYNWTILDTIFNLAKKHNKKVKIEVAPGFYSPDWVLNTSSIQKEYFTVPQGPFKEELRPLPLPWDQIYLQLWHTFIQRLANRYNDNPNFSYISATGPNSHNGEVALPREKSDQKKWLSLAGSSQLLKENLEIAWKDNIKFFCDTFAEKKFTIALILKSLPSNVSELENEYKNNLAQYGIDACPQTFGLQTNGLDGRPIYPEDKDEFPQWQLISGYSQQILIGFQTRALVNLYDCKVSEYGCSERRKEILTQTLIINGMSYKPNFIEIYEFDILDQNLTSIIAQAHSMLLENK